MDALELKDLAKQLREGAKADIWADVDEVEEYSDHLLIVDAQTAMIKAADFLDKLAELIE